MKANQTTSRAAIIFLAVFVISVILLERRTYEEAQKGIRDHALVVADSLWHYNRRGVQEYLILACKRDHYKQLTVRDSAGRNFIRLAGPPATGCDRLFISLGLIHEIPLAATISYDEQSIGEIRAHFYCQSIYSELYVLFALLLLYLILILYINLLHTKQNLEIRVQERTRELDRLNQSLRREIEKQQQAEREKQRSEERFQKLADLLPIPVWEADLDHKFTYLNRAGYETFALTPEEVATGVSIQSLLLPKDHDRDRDNYQWITAGERSSGDEYYWCQARDGRKFPVLIYSAAIIQDGKTIGIRGVTVNISERIEAEKKLQENQKKLVRARKMESLGLLAGGVAHDLNNILAGIVTYPEILLLDLDQQSPLYKPLETIRKSGLQAAAIVQDLLTIARGEATTREPLQLNHLIREYLQSPEFGKLIANHPEITVVTRLEDSLAWIKGSAVHLHKVIMNLVTNAVEAIENGKGRVEISTNNLHLDNPLSGYDEIAPGKYAVLTITDSGKGIPAEDLERIFEPFYTRKVMGRSGTGLGLAIVWNTVKDHHAYIHVTSNPGGTTFKLYFPTTLETGTENETAVPLQEYLGNRETILIVDDNESQRDVIKRLLSRLNYQVETTASGEEAITVLHRKDFDLVLLDMIMEPGINGRQTYEEIIKFKPHQKTVIVSGYAATEEVTRAQQAGAGAFIQKPVTLKSLGRVLRENFKKT